MIDTLAAAMTSLSAATDIAKVLRETDVSLERADLKLRLADLVGSLADAKLQLVEVQDAIAQRDARIAELQAAFQSKDELVRYRDAYYVADLTGEPAGEPLCARCWDVDQRRYQMQHSPTNRRARVCPACRNEVDGAYAQFLGDPADA